MSTLITLFFLTVNDANQTPQLLDDWDEYFPLPQMRAKQEKALDFVYRMLAQGITDIIIAAPTGVGKSAIGATLAFWAASRHFPIKGVGGAYYLCTQKLLQDQLDNDIQRYPPMLQSACSLKTASEYDCGNYGDCGTGRKHNPPCVHAVGKTCNYKIQVSKFLGSQLAITNYPYFFTERCFIQQFPTRRFLICDECHTLEGQLLKFAELIVGQHEIEHFMPTLKFVPVLPTLEAFADWIEQFYLVGLQTYLESFDMDTLNAKRAREYDELVTHIGRVQRALYDFANEPDNWIYWQEIEQRNGTAGTRVSIAKPLNAAGYFNELIRDAATVRIYMSAYPGEKNIFCRMIGLDPKKAAMLHLGSTFKKENRPINLVLVGSMSKRNQEDTMPAFLRFLRRIMDWHPEEKGIIHCNSYALGTAIFRAFQGTDHGLRLLFPTNADEREAVYKRHLDSPAPTIILSPSFTEGFDFADDAARWQVIAKIPYPYLGDKQVAAKKEADPEWYAQKTVEKIIQASGRICRNETDHGVTYITDSDFELLWDRYQSMFPDWWKEAMVWH